jgi:DNA repair exonuclease SbcCD nuclease subunit
MFVESISGDNPDIFVHGGDMFDTVFPPGHIFDLGLSLLQSIPQPASEVSISEVVRGEANPSNIFITHGNHDGSADARCDSGYFSILKYFDSMSLCNYMDVRKSGEEVYLPRFIVEGNGVRIGLQGLGHRSISQFQNLFAIVEPLRDVDINILVIHQSIAELTAPYTPGEILPLNMFTGEKNGTNFDLVLAGHTHKIGDDLVDRTRFIVPGSSERIDSGEFGEEKGYHLIQVTPDDIQVTLRKIDVDQIRKIRKYDVDVDGLSGSEITNQCVGAVTDPDLVDALIYFVLRGHTPHGHMDVDRKALEESLVERGARAVKVNTEKVVRKDIGELMDRGDISIKVTEETFQTLFAERTIRDLTGAPIRDPTIISLLSKAAFGIFRAYEREEKQDVQAILEKDMVAIAEMIHGEEGEE